MDNQSKNFFHYAEGVVKGNLSPIAQRFDVLLKERGLKWSDAYHEIGLNKGYASKIRRGLIIPPLWLRIRIAQFFKVDTSVIWRLPEIHSADQLEKPQIENEVVETDNLNPTNLEKTEVKNGS